VKEIKKMLDSSLVDENVALTRGYNMAFGVMSPKLYDLLQGQLFDVLLKNAVPKGKESDDAETRKFALKSLNKTLQRWGMHNVPIHLLQHLIETFYQGLNDY
jgi:hypothetical protein